MTVREVAIRWMVGLSRWCACAGESSADPAVGVLGVMEALSSWRRASRVEQMINVVGGC